MHPDNYIIIWAQTKRNQSYSAIDAAVQPHLLPEERAIIIGWSTQFTSKGNPSLFRKVTLPYPSKMERSTRYLHIYTTCISWARKITFSKKKFLCFCRDDVSYYCRNMSRSSFRWSLVFFLHNWNRALSMFKGYILLPSWLVHMGHGTCKCRRGIRILLFNKSGDISLNSKHDACTLVSLWSRGTFFQIEKSTGRGPLRCNTALPTPSLRAVMSYIKWPGMIWRWTTRGIWINCTIYASIVFIFILKYASSKVTPYLQL